MFTAMWLRVTDAPAISKISPFAYSWRIARSLTSRHGA